MQLIGRVVRKDDRGNYRVLPIQDWLEIIVSPPSDLELHTGQLVMCSQITKGHRVYFARHVDLLIDDDPRISGPKTDALQARSMHDIIQRTLIGLDTSQNTAVTIYDPRAQVFPVHFIAVGATNQAVRLVINTLDPEGDGAPSGNQNWYRGENGSLGHRYYVPLDFRLKLADKNPYNGIAFQPLEGLVSINGSNVKIFDRFFRQCVESVTFR